MLVHADAVALSLSYVLIPVEFDERLVSDAAELPAGWRDDLSLTRGVGDQWVAASKSPILRVPSALLAIDPNYIINPAHPDRAQIRIGSPQPLIVDERIKALFAGK
jgi:RES domain-containing protein